MMRKLVLAFTIAALIGVAAGCKDNPPTQPQGEMSKPGYTANFGKYNTRGGGGTGDATTTTP